MSEITIYLTRAFVLVAWYGVSIGGKVVTGRMNRHVSKPRLLLDKVCPEHIRKAAHEAFWEVATIAIAVMALNMIGVV